MIFTKYDNRLMKHFFILSPFFSLLFFLLSPRPSFLQKSVQGESGWKEISSLISQQMSSQRLSGSMLSSLLSVCRSLCLKVSMEEEDGSLVEDITSCSPGRRQTQVAPCSLSTFTESRITFNINISVTLPPDYHAVQDSLLLTLPMTKRSFSTYKVFN